jgi:hypothetical protein
MSSTVAFVVRVFTFRAFGVLTRILASVLLLASRRILIYVLSRPREGNLSTEMWFLVSLGVPLLLVSLLDVYSLLLLPLKPVLLFDASDRNKFKHFYFLVFPIRVWFQVSLRRHRNLLSGRNRCGLKAHLPLLDALVKISYTFVLQLFFGVSVSCKDFASRSLSLLGGSLAAFEFL